DRLHLSSYDGVERQFERLPVEVVADLQPAIDDTQWRVEPAGAGDGPAGGVARHLALFRADHRATNEDPERGFAGCRGQSRLLRHGQPRQSRGQTDQRGTDTMA